MRKLSGTIIVLLMFTGIFFLIKNFIKTEYFNIEEIQVLGEENSLNKKLLENLNFLKDKNIIYINVSKLESFLAQDIRIKDIKIEKKLPSKLLVNIETRKPYVYIKNKEKLYLGDRELNLFGIATETLGENIPVVTYENDETKDDIKLILSRIENENLYQIISEIRKKNGEYELILLNGIYIITDITVTSDKYDKVYKLYEKIKQTQPIKYMDIRFKDINVSEI